MGRCIAWQSVSLGSTALVMCGWYLCSRVRMRAHTQPPRAGVRSSHMLQAVIEFRAHARAHSTTSASRLNYISLAQEAGARGLDHNSLAQEWAGLRARRGTREKHGVSLARERAVHEVCQRAPNMCSRSRHFVELALALGPQLYSSARRACARAGATILSLVLMRVFIPSIPQRPIVCRHGRSEVLAFCGVM